MLLICPSNKTKKVGIKKRLFILNSLFFLWDRVQQYPYLLRPPPPRAPADLDGPDDLEGPADLDGLADLDVVGLFDERGDVDLLDVEVPFEEGLDCDFVGFVDALLFDEVLFLVRPACEFDGLVDALLDAPFEARPACDVDGRDPPLPAVLKFPFLTFLFTVFEELLLLLL